MPSFHRLVAQTDPQAVKDRQMKRTAAIALTFLLFLPSYADGGFFDDVMKKFSAPADSGPDENTVVSGLKEALTIGAGNAVTAVSSPDGFFGNVDIRIPMPEKLKKAEKVLRKVGYDDQVDEFILSMNRAAEEAAPRAAEIFVEAIRNMSIQDAAGILNGGDTAATEFFRENTHDELFTLFGPVITTSMGKVGAVKSYNRMNKKYTSLPFVKEEPVDLEVYVTERSLYGLYFMIGKEEQKIRKDPAARVTKLLKSVFGK